MARIVVGVADCHVAADPEASLVTYALGSCIGLAAYDPVAGVGGLLHFMLPESSLDVAKSRDNPCMFADTGIPVLLERMSAHGASKRRLVVSAAGAAQLLDDQKVFEIGKRNYLATRRQLWKHGILLKNEAVGGADFRTVILELDTGRLLLQEAGRTREWASASRRKGDSVVIPHSDRG
ncbi:MAG: chemotaxis protein CheD [Acidobacteriia bacterium]|nr:chemotaxis protein CheD [Terriglobia bacterium]